MAVILYSFIFSAICLIPSQNAILHPFDIGYKNPTVDSNVWCKGKNDNITSFSCNLITDVISIKLLTIFLCDNFTAFDIDVVPDVNNIICISSGFILASKNSLLPFSNNSFPSFISFSIE